MKLLQPTRPYTRRKIDQEEWEKTIDELAQRLCTAEEWRRYYQQQEEFQPVVYVTEDENGEEVECDPEDLDEEYVTAEVKVFPVWRKYRGRAEKIAQLQFILPFLQKLPVRWSLFLSDLLMK